MGLRSEKRKERYATQANSKSGPLVVAVDSTSEWLHIVLLRGNDVVCRVDSFQHHGHAKHLLPLLDAALAASGAVLDDVAVFCMGTGPGSFTGIRVGLAALKGLCFAASKPGVGVMSTEAIVRGSGVVGGNVMVCIDAKRGEYYFSVWSVDQGTWVETVPAFAATLEQGPQQVLSQAPSGPIWASGPAAATVLSSFEALEPGRVTCVSPDRCSLDPVVFARTGYESFVNGKAQSASAIEPCYARGPNITVPANR